MNKMTLIVEEYSYALNEIKNKNYKDLKKLKESIKLTKKYLNKLRFLVKEKDFPSQEEEIFFFKVQKPLVLGKLKYFINLHNFLTDKPKSNIAKQRKHINSILKELELQKSKHLEFYRYYVDNENTLDRIYFLRGNEQLEIFIDTEHFDKDPEFSTSHDYQAAEVVAYNLLTTYYNQELIALDLKQKKLQVKEVKPAILNNLSWTSSKTDLVELIYALNASGAIKNGQAELKKVAEICKLLFNIELGNFYKTYSEIKARQKDQTKFLDQLKYALTKKIESEY